MSGVLQKASRRILISRVLFVALIATVALSVFASSYVYLSAQKTAAQAHAHLLQGQVFEAREHLEQLLWWHPQNAHANLVLGKIELQEGAASRAVDCFRISARNANLHKQASLQLARSLALDGQLTAAEDILEDYLRHYEATASAWDLYFRLLYLQTRTRDVIALFERKFAAASPTVRDAGFLLKAEFIPQEPRETLGALEAIHANHPEDVNVQVALAIALMRVDEYVRSEQLLSLALKLQPQHHRARIVLAQWLADQQRFAEASGVLWRGGEAPSKVTSEGIAGDDRFWSLSSRLAEQNGRHEIALDCINQALQIRANDKHYLVQRSRVLRQLGSRQQATFAAKDAIQAGQVEQELFLLARTLQNTSITPEHCRIVSQLYLQLQRPMRAELWKKLASASFPMEGDFSRQEGIELR